MSVYLKPVFSLLMEDKMRLRKESYPGMMPNIGSLKIHSRRYTQKSAILFVLFLLVASGGGVTAQSPRDVLRATLDNGMKVVIVRNTLAPAATTVVPDKADWPDFARS